MILVNKEGKEWSVNLRFRPSGGMYYIKRGWRSFCNDNKGKVGDSFLFNLVGDGKTTPLMCVCVLTNECMRFLCFGFRLMLFGFLRT